VRFSEGGLRAYPLNLILYVVRLRLTPFLIYTVLIMTGTTRSIFRKGKALLLKVGSMIPISQDSKNQIKNGGGGCSVVERTRVRLW
jgi:hypothetical protein